MTTTKIALILGGSGSLGTYSAGAVTELLSALAANGKAASVRVGAVAGASAGALTAALVARALVVNPRLVPWIGTAWIRGMDAEVLLGPDRPRASILDAGVVEEMSRALITAAAASDDEPSPLLAESLQLGIALSSLQGIPYELRSGFGNRPDRSTGARLFDDWAAFELGVEDSATAPVWEEIRRAAVASASFPFAFPSYRLRRSGMHFRGSELEKLGDVDMWYADGALLNNETVRLAKRLVARAGSEGDDWRFILVDPTLSSSPYSDADAEEPASSARVASLLARALAGQGGAKDWIRANRTNDRLAILDSIVERLPEIADSLTDPDAFELGRSIGELAESVCEWQLTGRRGGRSRRAAGSEEDADPVLELLEQSVARIERRYASVLGRVGSRAARSRLAKLIFLIEAAGGLDDKEEMPLHLVSPSERLVGDCLGGFGGLFSREWREADYRAGRRDARRLLETSLAGLVGYEPDDEDAYEVPELDTSIEALRPEERRRFENLVEREVERWIGEMDPGFLANLVGFLWKPALRRSTTARVIESLRTA